MAQTAIEKYRMATDLYLKVIHGTVSETTYDNYRTALEMFGEFYAKSQYKDADPTAFVVAAWKDELLKTRKASTVRQYMQRLQIFFAWTIEDGVEIYKRNAVGKKAKPKVTRKPYDRKKLLDPKQILALLDPNTPTNTMYNTASRYKARNRAIVVLIMTSGLRSSEVAELALSDLDFEKGTITVQSGKGDKARITSFPSVAQEAIQDYLNSGFRGKGVTAADSLFGTESREGGWKAMNRFDIAKAVMRYVKAVTGLDNIRGHALRHAYASFALLQGLPVEDISALLGHSDIKTTEIYISRLVPSSSATKGNSIFDKAEQRTEKLAG